MTRRWETKPEEPIRLKDFRPRDPDWNPERNHKPASVAWALLWLLPIVWVVAIVIIFTRLFNHIIVWG